MALKEVHQPECFVMENHFVILKVSKQCSKPLSKCPICGKPKTKGHMLENHRVYLNHLYASRPDYAAGKEDMKSYRPHWHLNGRKI